MFEIIKPSINIDYSDIACEEEISNTSIKNKKIEFNNNIKINSSIFENVSFNNTSIEALDITDVIFKNCDLSNLSFINSIMYRVEFINCKLYGTSFIDCTFNNVKIDRSMCKYINMSDNDIIKSVFEDCSFEESIIKNCKLNKVIFNNINFNLSNIYNTKLKDIDLSSCNLRNIYSDLNSIKGSIIEPYQAMDLIPLLEVKIRSKYENN